MTPNHPVVNSGIRDAIPDGFALDVVSARAAGEGRFTLWNPYAGDGVPHLAAGFSRMPYPPFWIGIGEWRSRRGDMCVGQDLKTRDLGVRLRERPGTTSDLSGHKATSMIAPIDRCE